MAHCKESEERSDRLRLFAHALAQPLTVLGMAIVSMERHERALCGDTEAAAFIRDLAGLRRTFERLTTIVAEMRPREELAPDGAEVLK